MFTIVLICCFAAGSMAATIPNPEKKYNNQSEVIDDTLDYLFSCMQELDINPDICAELLLKDKDHNDKKYDNCKCFGPCIGKKLGTMNLETGKWNIPRFYELSSLMENESMKEEGEIIKKYCRDEVNSHCEAGYALMKCIMEHSPMAKDMAKNYLASIENIKENPADE